MSGQVQERNPEMVDILRADFINCWEPLALWDAVLEEPLASLTFASLPDRYRSLVLVAQLRTDAGAETDYWYARFNGDGGNNYDWFRVTDTCGGDDARACSRATSGMYLGECEAASSRAYNFTPCVAWLVGYSRSDCEKWAWSEGGGAFGDVSADTDMTFSKFRGRWRDLSVVTSVTLHPVAGSNFVTGSRVYVYGVI